MTDKLPDSELKRARRNTNKGKNISSGGRTNGDKIIRRAKSRKDVNLNGFHHLVTAAVRVWELKNGIEHITPRRLMYGRQAKDKSK